MSVARHCVQRDAPTGGKRHAVKRWSNESNSAAGVLLSSCPGTIVWRCVYHMQQQAASSCCTYDTPIVSILKHMYCNLPTHTYCCRSVQGTNKLCSCIYVVRVPKYTLVVSRIYPKYTTVVKITCPLSSDVNKYIFTKQRFRFPSVCSFFCCCATPTGGGLKRTS